MMGLMTEANVGEVTIYTPWRYEVRWKDAKGAEHVYGWTTAADGGQMLWDARDEHGNTAFVVDRQVHLC